MPLNLRRGDVLRLRKPHPCGSIDFEVVRLGADIGLRCTTLRAADPARPEPAGAPDGGFVSRAPEAETPTDLDLDLERPRATAPTAVARR